MHHQFRTRKVAAHILGPLAGSHTNLLGYHKHIAFWGIFCHMSQYFRPKRLRTRMHTYLFKINLIYS
ncbi:MAG: hypothetical protein ACKPKO_01795 [Candidatus Fonsibacter sp.]